MLKASLLILLLQLTLFSKDINLNHLLNFSKIKDKHLFVWIHKTSCNYCDRMQESTLEQDDVKIFIKNNFIFTHINVSENDTIRYEEFVGTSNEFAQEIGYTFYPSSLFFDFDGDIVFSEVGYVDSKGNPNYIHFLKVLNYINMKAYEELDFYEYKYVNEGGK